MASTLTVAEIAALINVALVILQITYPMLVSFISVGVLKTRVNASTWSVFGLLVNQSFWPWILGCDSSSSRKADRRVSGLSHCSKAASVLLAVAAATTPLGLYATFQWSNLEKTPFSYARDASPLGKATMPRDLYTTNRLCFSGVCPGNYNGSAWIRNSNHSLQRIAKNPYASTVIAPNITDVFTSGTSDGTIAGIFNIEYRAFSNFNDEGNSEFLSAVPDHGRPRSQGEFRYYQQYLLDSKAEAITGLVISTSNNPGIGFRNHTSPVSSTDGYIWEEDILWLEPETACTNLNVTFDYTMPSYSENAKDARLTDRGGILSALTLYTEPPLGDAQNDPELLKRSWHGATQTNHLLARAMNVSVREAHIGRTYNLDRQERHSSGFTTGFKPTPNQIAFSEFGEAQNSDSIWWPQLPDPIGLAFKFDTIGTIGLNIAHRVKGYGGFDLQGISQVGIAGGILLGVGRQVDANGTGIPNAATASMVPGTKWSQPLFSCASAVKASIKRVQFRVDGGSALENLVVESIQSLPSAVPLWGVENTGRTIHELDPLWGVVADQEILRPGLSTLRRSHLYLPAGFSSLWGFVGLSVSDAVAGATAPLSAFSAIYYAPSDLAGNTNLDKPNYSAGTSWSLYTKWLELCADASSINMIPNLIWTDIMANFVVGTKNILSSTGARSAQYPARRHVEVTAYRWKYAVVALLFAVSYLVIAIILVILYATKRCDIATLRFLLNQSSAGRSMTTERYSGSSSADIGDNKEWAQVRGDEMVLLGKADVRRRVRNEKTSKPAAQSEEVEAANTHVDRDS